MQHGTSRNMTVQFYMEAMFQETPVRMSRCIIYKGLALQIIQDTWKLTHGTWLPGISEHLSLCNLQSLILNIYRYFPIFNMDRLMYITYTKSLVLTKHSVSWWLTPKQSLMDVMQNLWSVFWIQTYTSDQLSFIHAICHVRSGNLVSKLWIIT